VSALLGIMSFLCVVLSLLAGHPSVRPADTSAKETRAPHASMRTGNNKAHPTPWVVVGVPGEKSVRIRRTLGWCPNPANLGLRPRIVGVRQVDKPSAVILTPYLVHKSQPSCLVVTPVEYVVHIRNGLQGRPLYDGSQSPPVRRWPR